MTADILIYFLPVFLLNWDGTMLYLQANTIQNFRIYVRSFHTYGDDMDLDDERCDLLGSQSVVPRDQ